MKQILSALLLMLASVLVTISSADARPTYFLEMTRQFEVPEGTPVHECIVCHLNYTGTGTRNPFGFSVQQHLYTGKSIHDALTLVASLDSDNDGYTNDEELRVYLTQPGFSCDNFEDARGEPLDFDASVTPGVATCREPVEIEVLPTTAGFVTDAGTTDTFTIDIWNLGYSADLTITDLPDGPGVETVVASGWGRGAAPGVGDPRSRRGRADGGDGRSGDAPVRGGDRALCG